MKKWFLRNKKRIFLCMLIFLILFAFYSCTSEIGNLVGCVVNDMVSNEVTEEILSPDGEMKAVIFRRSAGATTRFSYCVSILENNEDVENVEVGNVYHGYSEVSVKWENDKNVLISIASKDDEVFKSENSYNGIHITYVK